MWRFNSGYLGACAIAISILAGVLFGSIANVDTHTVNTTEYQYKTDITGLFDVSQEPQFIDYNPASNYTGYTNTVSNPSNPSGIEYTHTNVANNYRIQTSQPQAIAGPSGTINNNTNLPQYQFTHEGVNVPSRVVLGSNSPELVYTDYIRTGEVRGFKVSTMYDLVSYIFGDLTQYQTITLTIGAQSITAPTTRAGIGTASYWPQAGYYDILNQITAGSSRVFTIDPVNMTYSYTPGPSTFTYSLYTSYVFYGNATQYETQIRGSSTSTDTHQTTLSLSYTSMVTRYGTYDYMLPANGTEISPSAQGTRWDNDQGTTNYDNNRIDVIFGPRFVNGEFVLNDSARGVAINVDKADGTPTRYTVYHENGKWYVNYVSVGSFPAIMVSLYEQRLEVRPITSFIDYQNVTVVNEPVIDGVPWYTHNLDFMTFTREYPGITDTGDNIAWSVYNTNVFMETYNAVMVDPSIDLADYWPDMDSYRFSINSVALYGETVTINGQTYQIENQAITINGRAYQLKNCYISYSKEGQTTITFNDVNRSVDLGETVDKTLSFGGNWGFSMGLYEGVASTKDVYDWDVSLFGDGLNTCVLIALGVLAIITLVCVWLRFGLKMTDKIIIGAGAVILIMLLVV